MLQHVPESVRTMRIAAWMWMIFLACIALMDLTIYAGRPAEPIPTYYLINLTLALIFLGLAYAGWLNAQPQLAVASLILLISAGPLLVQHLFNLRLPPAPLSNLEGMVLRQLPVLMIGLVLVAWHYRLAVMIAYSVTVNLFELLLGLMLDQLNGDRVQSFFFIIIIRTVCFLVVGIFINQLITYLRKQWEALKAANQQLSHYAAALETLTVSRERNRMSRELHDTVVHTLSGLSVQLETAKAYWEVEPATAHHLIEESLEATRSGLQETRRALKALRASPLDDLGFILALSEMASTAAERADLTLAIDLPEPCPVLPPDVEQCVYRVAQEAVENVVHHANARQLCLRLTVNQQELILVVQDDGVGFYASEASFPGHFGLAGMRERAELAGGELSISSQPNSGTTIRLVVKGCVQ